MHRMCNFKTEKFGGALCSKPCPFSRWNLQNGPLVTSIHRIVYSTWGASLSITHTPLEIGSNWSNSRDKSSVEDDPSTEGWVRRASRLKINKDFTRNGAFWCILIAHNISILGYYAALGRNSPPKHPLCNTLLSLQPSNVSYVTSRYQIW